MARLPDCAGQAADAVSAYTQVRMEGDPKFVKKIPFSPLTNNRPRRQLIKAQVSAAPTFFLQLSVGPTVN